MDDFLISDSPVVDQRRYELRSLFAREGSSYVLIRIPKTASASLSHAIFDATHSFQDSGMNLERRVEPSDDTLWWNHYSAQFCIETLGITAWEKAVSISVVRNPWARLFSIWRYSKCAWETAHLLGRDQHPDDGAVARLTFEQWLMNGCYHPSYSKPHQKSLFPQDPVLSQYGWLSDENDTVTVDVVLRLEELEGTGVRVLKELFGQRFEMPEAKVNQTSMPHDYISAYKPHMIEYVNDVCSADIDAFGYTFDGLKSPRLVLTNDKKFR